VFTPIFRIGQKLGRLDAPQFLDSIPDLHRSTTSPLNPPRWALSDRVLQHQLAGFC
jgi:hypothetical protein